MEATPPKVQKSDVTPRFGLGISHVLFIGAAVALYAGKPIVTFILGVVLAAVAAFVRMMVPYPKRITEPKRIAENGTRKILLVVQFLGAYLVFLWLLGIGLTEFIEKAFVERFSALLIVGVTVFLAVALIRDWNWLLGLSNEEVEAFYAKKAEPEGGANGSPPIRAEKNSTSRAAGSRPSP